LASQEFGFHVYGSEGQLDVTAHELRIQNGERKGWRPIHLDSGKSATSQILQVSELISWLNGQTDNHRGSAYQARTTLESLMAIFESVRTHGVVYPPLTISESPLDIMVESGIR
jgi:hypothetical protein